jgi:hypothetical protein
MKKTIDWNDKLKFLFLNKKRTFGVKSRTIWANYLRRHKIKRFLINENQEADELIDLINSTKKRYVWVGGERLGVRKRPSNGHPYTMFAVEILLVPPKLAQKILVLGGLP